MQTRTRIAGFIAITALVGSGGVAASAPAAAQSEVIVTPYDFAVSDSDDGTASKVSADGQYLFGQFIGRQRRIEISQGVGSVIGPSPVDALSGDYWFNNSDSGTIFFRNGLFRDVRQIDSLPWAGDDPDVVSTDGFGRYVMGGGDRVALHDTETGMIWAPRLSPSDVATNPGPHSISADGNLALFRLGCGAVAPSGCPPPDTLLLNRASGHLSRVAGSALSPNGRFLVGTTQLAPGTAITITDLVLGESTVFNGLSDDLGEVSDLFVDNTGRTFWIGDGHVFRRTGAGRHGGNIEQIDVDATGAPADAPTRWLSVSADGGRVVFVSQAENLAIGGGIGNDRTFVGIDTTVAGRYLSAPRAVDAAGVHPKQASLSWEAGPFGQVPETYAIFRNSVEIAQTSDTSMVIAGVSSGNSYFQVQAVSSDGTRSVKTAPIRVKTDFDRTRPSTPTGLSGRSFPALGPGADALLNWSASTDNSSVVRYAIYDRNQLVSMVDNDPEASVQSFIETVGFNERHWYQVRAIDLNGNQSVKTAPVLVET